MLWSLALIVSCVPWRWVQPSLGAAVVCRPSGLEQASQVTVAFLLLSAPLVLALVHWARWRHVLTEADQLLAGWG